MGEPSGNDRRVYKRIEARIEVSMQSENNFYTGFTQDISEGGVFIAGMSLLPLGTEVQFDLALAPGKTTVPVKGVVRWVREYNTNTAEVPPGMGIEFVDLHPKVRERVNLFIRRRESLFFDDDDL